MRFGMRFDFGFAFHFIVISLVSVQLEQHFATTKKSFKSKAKNGKEAIEQEQ